MTPDEFFTSGPGKPMFDGLWLHLRPVLFKILSSCAGQPVRLSGPPGSGKSYLLQCCAAYVLHMLHDTHTCPAPAPVLDPATIVMGTGLPCRLPDWVGCLSSRLSSHAGVHVIRETSDTAYGGPNLHSAFLDWQPHAAGRRELLRQNFLSRKLGGWFIVVDGDDYVTIALPGLPT